MKRLLPVLLILLLSTVAFAQTNKGRIMGTVTTEEGAVIPGVKVTITSDALISSTLTHTTNDRGMYRFVLLPVGTYDILFEKEGYTPFKHEGVALAFDVTQTIDIVMRPAEYAETIIISGEAPVVDKTSSSIGDKLDTEVLLNTPTNDANVWALPNLSAGVDDDSALGGVERAGNSFNIDGSNVSDPATSTDYVRMNLEAVEQVDVSMFGAPAEYGTFTGAALNIITKSGGNDFSGEANFFAQRVDWVADNTTEYENLTTPTAADVNQYGAALGGPVARDKIWFFGNYNYRKEETQREVADGPITVTVDPQRWFGKVSARWDDRNITFASLAHSEREVSHRYYQGTWLNNVESSLWTQESKDYSWNIHHSFVFNDDIIFEGRYAAFRGEFNLVPRLGEDAPLMWDSGTGYMLPGSNANRHDEINRDRDNWLVTMNYFNDDLNGSHSMKFGFEVEDSLSARYISLTGFQYWYYGEPRVWYDYGSWESATAILRIAAYGQDSWAINDRLTLNLGLRWDRTDEKADDPDVAPIGDENIFRFNDVAYRLGFVYDLFGDGKTVVRGFAGRYYEAVVSQDVEPFVTDVGLRREYRWNGSEWILYDEWGGSANLSVDPDYSNHYTEGVTFGVEHELMPNLALSSTFIYKRDKNVVGQISPEATWDEEQYSYSNENGSYSGVLYTNYLSGTPEIITNPKKGDVGVLDDLYRDYYGFMIELNKRMSDNWSMRANYTYAYNVGTASQLYGAVQGFSNYSNPNFWINLTGRLDRERPHVFKVSGTYIAPFDIYISPVFSWRAGRSYPLLHRPYGISDYELYTKEIDGSDRYDSQLNLDLRLEKSFIFKERYRIGLLVDIYNAFNDDAVTRYVSTRIESSSFEVPATLVDPRFYQVGVRFIF